MVGDTAELFVEGWQEFLDERLSPRAVVGRVGENVMSKRTTGIERDAEELNPLFIVFRYRGGSPSLAMSTTESSNKVRC